MGEGGEELGARKKEIQKTKRPETERQKAATGEQKQKTKNHGKTKKHETPRKKESTITTHNKKLKSTGIRQKTRTTKQSTSRSQEQRKPKKRKPKKHETERQTTKAPKNRNNKKGKQ